jgi:hypothetical protein
MNTKMAALQVWLNARAATPKLIVDGMPGLNTRTAIIETFRNRAAAAVTDIDLHKLSHRLGCSVRQIKAVAKVESAGGGWDNSGLLKCLWERHYMWRRVRFALPGISDPKAGGYTTDADRDGVNDSWEKLADACLKFPPLLAFECASFGKFQIMGAHWKALGYRSAIDFVWQLSRSEAAHFDAFGRYIEVNGLLPALRRIDGDPENARALAKGYNGSGYWRQGYHEKMAAAWMAG